MAVVGGQAAGGVRSMEALGGVAPAGEGGNRAAYYDADHGEVLLGDSSLLEAERELKTNGDAMLSSTVILMLLLAWSAAVSPPAWFLAAQETGKQQLRVHLYLILHVSSMAAAVSTVTALCRYREGATLFGRPLAADRILATTRVVLAAIHASVAAICYLRGSDCWGETAVAVFVAWATAAFARRKLKGFFVMFDKVQKQTAREVRIYSLMLAYQAPG